MFKSTPSNGVKNTGHETSVGYIDSGAGRNSAKKRNSCSPRSNTHRRSDKNRSKKPSREQTLSRPKDKGKRDTKVPCTVSSNDFLKPSRTFEFLKSPSVMWAHTPLSLRIFLLAVGFLLFYKHFFSGGRPYIGSSTKLIQEREWRSGYNSDRRENALSPPSDENQEYRETLQRVLSPESAHINGESNPVHSGEKHSYSDVKRSQIETGSKLPQRAQRESEQKQVKAGQEMPREMGSLSERSKRNFKRKQRASLRSSYRKEEFRDKRQIRQNHQRRRQKSRLKAPELVKAPRSRRRRRKNEQMETDASDDESVSSKIESSEEIFGGRSTRRLPSTRKKRKLSKARNGNTKIVHEKARKEASWGKKHQRNNHAPKGKVFGRRVALQSQSMNEKDDSEVSMISNTKTSYEDLKQVQVKDGHIPILYWDTNAINNPHVPRQFFDLTHDDHVAVFKPLCVVPKTKRIITFEGKKACGGANKTRDWFQRHCAQSEQRFYREVLFKEANERPRNLKWLRKKEKDGDVRWVEGVSILQMLDKSCGNIAHFAGRVLMLNHVLRNFEAYSGPLHIVKNVVIIPTYHVMKRFIHPHNYGFYHLVFMRALLNPIMYEFGSFASFLKRAKKDTKKKKPNVFLIEDLADNNDEKLVCFRHAIVPAYLKGRFFVDDAEYPSHRISFKANLPEAPRVPRESLDFRENLFSIMHNSPELRQRSKKIVYLDREGDRRLVRSKGKKVLFKKLARRASYHGYSFEVISFKGMNIKQQVGAVEDVSIALGVHGANLVNTMFMPPLSVLIELFPFEFKHNMYYEGGGAGLKYYSYGMSTGKHYPKLMEYLSTEECIRFSVKCKLHYRDAELTVVDNDVDNITKMVDEAVAYLERLSKV